MSHHLCHQLCHTNYVTPTTSDQLCRTNYVTPSMPHQTMAHQSMSHKTISHKLCHTNYVRPTMSHQICHTNYIIPTMSPTMSNQLCHTASHYSIIYQLGPQDRISWSLITQHWSTSPLYYPQPIIILHSSTPTINHHTIISYLHDGSHQLTR